MNLFPFRRSAQNAHLNHTISEILTPKGSAPAKPYDKYEGSPAKGSGKKLRSRVDESHTRAALEKLSITRLRELKKKYEALVLKGDKGASRELADIRGLLRAKGAGSVLDEQSACEKAAMKRLKAANAADLKEYPGARGERAHARLHTTIGKILKQ